MLKYFERLVEVKIFEVVEGGVKELFYMSKIVMYIILWNNKSYLNLRLKRKYVNIDFNKFVLCYC